MTNYGQSNSFIIDNVFYLKVVDAQLAFNKNDKGEVAGVTLLQGGREVTGKRIE
ncbi:hypothetical protein [Flavivirga sp. 57AJ16]|uniref:hypothetical protein n=1 Tax=Flavivirga sp. 57AJ16 TaxID=3025307 RepID=UPI0023673E8D|nr:hypothetical protein [Flavivirga sp. 57AJ16]MDD7886173.1 hypothetical protein [Flavivirga sp. 57AJ16]